MKTTKTILRHTDIDLNSLYLHFGHGEPSGFIRGVATQNLSYLVSYILLNPQFIPH